MLISIQPNKATRRTINRIREHGPDFVLMKSGVPRCMDNQPSFLLSSVKDDWFGWLPTSEIIWKEK